MLVRVTKFAGTSLAIAGIRATILNPGSMPNARPVFIEQAQADQVYSGTYMVDVRNVALQLQITNYAARYALMSTIKGMFKRGTRGDLEATFGDDGLDYRLDCVVVSPAIQDPTYPDYFTVILQTGDSAWVAVVQDTVAWAPSGTGGTKVIAVGGNAETRLSLDITHTVAPSTGFLYKKLYRLVNVPPVTTNTPPIKNFGVLPWCLTIDHAALVTAGKSQAAGYDLRIWLGDRQTKRWITGLNTAATKIWFNPPIPGGHTLPLLTAVAGSGAISVLEFEHTPDVMAAIKSMPGRGVVYHGNEWFSYRSRDFKNYRLGGVTRGAYGTTEEAHIAAVDFKFIAVPIFLVYGNLTIGDPAADDVNYDDAKPVFDLSDSDNTQWVYKATSLFYDRRHPQRPGSWTRGLRRHAFNKDTYHYFFKGDAVSGDAALGARAANFVSGSTWKADFVSVSWSLFHRAGFYQVTATGNKYRSKATWLAKAAFQYSWNGRNWVDLWNEASPTVVATTQAWAAHTDVAVPADRNYLRFLFQGEFAGQPGNAFALCEGLTVTVKFVTANLPVGTLLSEELNAQMEAVVTNTENGDKVTLALPMKADMVLDMDGETNIVLLNGSNAYRAIALDDESRSAWIRLPAGNNEIQIAGADIGTLSINLKFYKRRLY